MPDQSAVGAKRSRFGPIASVAALAVLGVVLGCWPHASRWAASGDALFTPDSDALLYRAWSYPVVAEGAWSLSDRIHSPSGPMMHPWLLFVPPGWLARASGLDLGAVWRGIGGLGIALGLFVAIRPATRSAPIAAGLAAFLFCDAGFLFGQVGYRDLKILLSLIRGDGAFLRGVPWLLPHLRVPTPSLPIAVLLVHLGAVLRARRSGGWRPTLIAGFGFGLLFHVFFYFWTAAGLALVLAFLLDRDDRGLYLRVALIGGLVGLPAVLEGSRIKRSTPPDWLLRTDKFAPIGRWDELLVPHLLLAQFVLVTPFVFRKVGAGIYPWCLTLAGLALVNHQILTGLQIENFHWTHAYGVAFSLLLAMLVAPILERGGGPSRRLGLLLGVLLAAKVAGAFGLRTVETERSAETRHWRAIERAWLDEAPEFPAGAVVAGDPEALFVGAAGSGIRPLWGRLVEYSALATDPELDERLVLNLYLLGLPLDEARRAVSRPPGTWGQEATAVRSPILAEAQRTRRLELVGKIWADPEPWIDRFGVTHLALPRGFRPPETLTPRLGRFGQAAGAWTFWKVGLAGRTDSR